MSKRGRKAVLSTGKGRVALLNKFDSGEKVSRYHLEQLAELKLLERETVKTSEGRGRATVMYGLTGKARGLMAMAENWK